MYVAILLMPSTMHMGHVYSNLKSSCVWHEDTQNLSANAALHVISSFTSILDLIN